MTSNDNIWQTDIHYNFIFIVKLSSILLKKKNWHELAAYGGQMAISFLNSF